MTDCGGGAFLNSRNMLVSFWYGKSTVGNDIVLFGRASNVASCIFINFTKAIEVIANFAGCSVRQCVFLKPQNVSVALRTFGGSSVIKIVDCCYPGGDATSLNDNLSLVKQSLGGSCYVKLPASFGKKESSGRLWVILIFVFGTVCGVCLAWLVEERKKRKDM
jgi:hypothetical protein